MSKTNGKHIWFHKLTSDIPSILIIGLILRLIIAPFTLNWDLRANTKVAMKFGTIPLSEFYQEPLAAYPPLMYGILKSALIVSGPFLPSNFNQWLTTPDLDAVSDSRIFQTLFVLKFPAILTDLLTGYLFSQMVKGKYRLGLLIYWMIHPLALFLIPGWTNIDMFPLLFIVGSLLAFKKNRNILSAFLLGIAFSLKVFSIFLIPFLILTQPTIRKKISVFFASLIPIIVVHLPVLSVPSYWSHVFTGGYSKQILFSTIPIGSDRVILYVVFLYLLLLFRFWFCKEKREQYISYQFLALVPVFIFTAFSYQWILWLFPFFAYSWITVPTLRLTQLILVGCYFGMILLAQPVINIGLLVPIDPTFWRTGWFIKTRFGVEQLSGIVNLLNTTFVACLAWISLQTINPKNRGSKN